MSGNSGVEDEVSKRRAVRSFVLVPRTTVLDESSFRIHFKDRVTQLTSVEFLLLKTMHDAPGRIFSRDNLMSQIYTDYRVVSDRTIDSHIKKLRKKLTEIDLPDQVIHSIYGPKTCQR